MMFENRKGSSETGKAVWKPERQFGNRKRMFKINVNSENILPKTNIFVHKLNGKIGVENPLNFTYT